MFAPAPRIRYLATGLIIIAMIVAASGRWTQGRSGSYVSKVEFVRVFFIYQAVLGSFRRVMRAASRARARNGPSGSGVRFSAFAGGVSY